MRGAAVEPAFGRFRAFLAETGLAPSTAIVLGSGLGDLAGRLEGGARAGMDDLLAMEAAPVAGHAREVVVGRWREQPVLLFLGRYHLYQGLTATQCAAPIRALAGTSVRRVILTNAAGGLNPAFQVGDLMLIADHLNFPGLAGHSPLVPPPAGVPVTFVSLRDAYDPGLRRLAWAAAERAGLAVREGVYAMVVGPSYETAAELRMLRAAGADAVGMSTVPEVVMARALGIDVLAISTITNRAVPEEAAPPSHEEVLREGRRAAERLACLLESLLPELG